MASTPFFFLSGLLFLAWFTADVHSVKVLPDVFEGSTVILRPVEAVSPITVITWKHGDDLAVDWNGGNPAFYNIFKDTCSLNTETGELTINNVRPEHSGVYTPEINGKTKSAMKLRVFSPVPKPSITMNCNPGETNCTLSCLFDRTDDLGDVEVSWILDDRHRENGTELQIAKDTKTETFICSLKNPFSSKNSTKLLNPFHPSVPVWKPVVITLGVVAVALLVGFIILKYRCYRIIIEIRETMPLTEHGRISAEVGAAGPVTDVDQALLNSDKEILRTLNEGIKRNLSKDSILMLLTARYLILRTLQQGTEVQNSLENVKKIMERFFKGTNDLWLYEDEKQTLQDVQRILRILKMRSELKLPRVFTDEEMTILKFRKILDTKRNYLQLSEDENKTLHDVCEKILTLIKREEETVVRDEQSPQNGGPEAEDPLISSSRFEVVDPV